MHSILLAIEDAYDCLLDAEDIDLVLSNPSHQEDTESLLKKRVIIIDNLFNNLNVFIPPDNMQPSKDAFYQQDEFFLRLSLVPKGRKLLARALPILTPDHINYILLSYIRNFGLFLDPPKGSEEELANLYEHLLKSTSSLTLAHIILGFKSLFYFYLQGAVTLLQFVQKKTWLKVNSIFTKKS